MDSTTSAAAPVAPAQLQTTTITTTDTSVPVSPISITPTPPTQATLPPNSNPTIPLPTPQPQAQIPIVQPPTQTPPQDQEALGFAQKLDAGDEHWRWKLPFRFALLVFAVIGTGCIGWAVQTSHSARIYWLYDDQGYLWWALVTFGVTMVWTLVYILVLMLRRPPRPVHPGVAVGLDLVLWLAYIFTTLLAVIACVNVLSFGADGYIGRYSSDGYYTQAANGTWVYSPTEYMIYRNRSRDCDSSSSYYTYSTMQYFDNCAEQDAWVNEVWRASRHRGQVEVTGAVCQGLCFILHFILFVWACVDTHRRNRRRPTKEAEKLAAEIVGRMVREGAVLQAPNPWRYAPLNGQPQQQQQWYGHPANQVYTVHQGPPPMQMQQMQMQQMQQMQQQPIMSGGRQATHITEHYGDVKGVGLGGPGPSLQRQPVVEHYAGEKGPGAA